MKQLFACFLGLAAFVSCNSSQTPPFASQERPEEVIYIWINNAQAVTINTETDSLVSYVKSDVAAEDSIRGSEFNRQKGIKSQSLSDSLSQIVNNLIRDSVGCGGEVSCYAGDYLRVTLKRGTAQYSVQFNSVDDWKDCSSNTRALSSLLKQNQLIE